MADKKDLTFEELTESLKKNNMEMSESVKKQIEAQLETNKIVKEDSVNNKKAVKDVHAESLKVLKEIKNILKSVAQQLIGSVKSVETNPVAAIAEAESNAITAGPASSSKETAQLTVIAKNTGALLMMSRDINVMRQNIQELVKVMGGEKKTGADKDFRKESVLREKAVVDIQRAQSATPASGGGTTPPMAPTDQGTGEKAGGFFGKLKGVAGNMSGWAKNLLALSAALFVTAKSFQEFSKVKWDGVIKGTVAMFALAKAAKMAGEGDNAKSILALGVGTLALAFAMDKFGSVEWESVGKGIVAMGALAVAARIAGKGDAAKSILALGVGAIALAFGMEKFADVSWDNVVAGSVAILALGTAARIAGSGDAAKSILALGVGVLAAAYGLDKFSEVDFEGIFKGSLALIALAGAARLAGSGDAYKSILALGVGTLALAFAMDKFAEVPLDGVLKGIGAIVALGVAANATGGDWKVIVALAAGMFVLSKAFENFAAISWTDFAKGIVAMIALVGAVNLASGSLAGGVAMVLLAGAVYVISEAFKNFAEISWGDVLKGIVAIGALAVGAALLAPLAIPIGITALALIALGGAMLVLGAGISAISESLPSITSGIKELADIDGMNLLQVAAGIGAVALALLAFGAAQMGAALENLIANFLSFGQDSPIDKIKELADIDGNKLRDTGDGLQSIADALSMMSNLDANNLEKVMDAMNDFPWLRATLLAKAGGVFTVTTKKGTMSGGDGSKIAAASKSAEPSPERATPVIKAPASSSEKVTPVSKAPVTTESFFLANEPVTKDMPLSKTQRAVMKQQIASGKSNYPDWVMQKYKNEGDQVAAQSSETAAAQRAPVAEGGGDRTLINAPTTVNKSTQNNITKLPVRNSDPAYVDYMRKRFSI